MLKDRNNLLDVKSGSYDQEWIDLMKEAKETGLTIAEIRNFLQKDESYSSIKISKHKTGLQHIRSV